MSCCANDDDDDNSAGLRTAISSGFVTILKDIFEDSVHMAATLVITFFICLQTRAPMEGNWPRL